jgi:hypothetical protein
MYCGIDVIKGTHDGRWKRNIEDAQGFNNTTAHKYQAEEMKKRFFPATKDEDFVVVPVRITEDGNIVVE